MVSSSFLVPLSVLDWVLRMWVALMALKTVNKMGKYKTNNIRQLLIKVNLFYSVLDCNKLQWKI